LSLVNGQQRRTFVFVLKWNHTFFINQILRVNIDNFLIFALLFLVLFFLLLLILVLVVLLMLLFLDFLLFFVLL